MEQEHEEHEVYGGDIPDDAEMDADFRVEEDEDPEGNQHDPNHSNKDLEDMKKRLKEIEEEASALREMQAKVEKEMGAVQDSNGSSASQAEKEEVDSRSIYVGNVVDQIGVLISFVKSNGNYLEMQDANLEFVLSSFSSLGWYQNFNVLVVDYGCTPEEVQQHFQSCGTVNRVTILTDKFGQPKGFAYVEFVEVDAIQNALLLNESELHGRQLKVSAKRTNVPGMKQYRGRRPMGFRPRMPYMPSPFYPPYGGYGRFPRYRRPTRFRPY